MSEFTKYRGLLAEKRLESKRLSLRMEGLVVAIRDNLNPFIALADLKTHIIAGQAVDLSECHTEYKVCLKQMKKIETEIGV